MAAVAERPQFVGGPIDGAPAASDAIPLVRIAGIHLSYFSYDYNGPQGKDVIREDATIVLASTHIYERVRLACGRVRYFYRGIGP